MSKKWCIKCKKELLGQDDSLGFLGITSGTGLYCGNSECPREGLVTVIFLQENSKAPETAEPNKPDTKKETD